MKTSIALVLMVLGAACGQATDETPMVVDGFECLPGVTNCDEQMWRAINGVSAKFETHGQAAVADRLAELPFNVAVLDVGGAQAACPDGTPGCTFTGAHGVRMLLEPRPIVSKLEGCEDIPMTIVHELGHVSLWFGKHNADGAHADPEMWGPGGVVAQLIEAGVCN